MVQLFWQMHTAENERLKDFDTTTDKLTTVKVLTVLRILLNNKPEPKDLNPSVAEVSLKQRIRRSKIIFTRQFFHTFL
jgi:hypothetical protein